MFKPRHTPYLLTLSFALIPILIAMPAVSVAAEKTIEEILVSADLDLEAI